MKRDDDGLWSEEGSSPFPAPERDVPTDSDPVPSEARTTLLLVARRRVPIDLPLHAGMVKDETRCPLFTFPLLECVCDGTCLRHATLDELAIGLREHIQ